MIKAFRPGERSRFAAIVATLTTVVFAEILCELSYSKGTSRISLPVFSTLDTDDKTFLHEAFDENDLLLVFELAWDVTDGIARSAQREA